MSRIGMRGWTVVLLVLAGNGLMVERGHAQQPPATEVEEAELEVFVEAYVAVRAISEAMEAELATVQDPEEAQAIQNAAREEMVAAVEEKGLELVRYQQIAAAVNVDPELREEFVSLLEEHEGPPEMDG